MRDQPVLEWEKLPSLPDREGFAGSYGGVVDGALVIAGGSNFPVKRPWEGGAKAWYDTVYTLEPGAAAWRTAGKLPRAGGYGLSFPWKHGFVMFGGGDASEHFADAWFVTRAKDGTLSFAALPKMPVPLANAAGALIKGTVYVAGGLTQPEAVASEAADVFFSLDLDRADAGWKTLPPCPGGGRFLATGGAIASANGPVFYLFGGVRLKPGADGKPAREYLRDAWRFRPASGWERIADLPHAAVAPPSPALAAGQSHLFLLGGDDGSQRHITGAEQARHPGFPRDLLAYHGITDTWTRMGEMPFSLVTTSLVPWNGGFAVTGGERMPGTRSPDVWLARIIKTKAVFGWLNYAALGGYLLAMVGIGRVCARRNKNTDDYFRAGGRIPWWAAGMAIYATMLSSLTFMAMPAKAYATDWTYIWTNAAIVIVAPLLVAVYLPFYRRLNITSAYEYLEKRFNLLVRLYGSAAFILFQVGRQAVVLLLPSLALAAVSDLNVTTCILVMGVFCVLYTVMGGMEAVIWTDVAQTVLLLGAALTSLVLIVFGTEGGLSGFWASAVENGKFHAFNFTWSPTVAASAFWVILVGNIFNALVPYTSDQAVVQRYLTTKTEKKAARAIWLNAALAVPSALLFFLIGTALFVFYKAHPERLDPSQATDSIFPAYIVQNLPAGIAGLVIAGIFAAAQSTVSGSLNSVATAIMTDFYHRFGGRASGAGALRLARALTVLFGVFATGAALVLANLNLASLWDAYNSLIGLAASGLAGLFALGIFTRRAGGIAAFCGAAASIVALAFVQRYSDLHFFLYAGIGMLTCFVIGWLAGFIFPSKKDLAGLTLGTLEKARPQ
ncbi:MAG TPA: sodium/solute symporter [Kiritimatiellia bacterium]|nr:sodium/solute symporter [Kiritimatiellia bacterium]HRU70552.1 sodium/solute symporter [Kiritimatiellia bacterium]